MEHLTSTPPHSVRIRSAGPLTRLLSLFVLILFVVIAFIIAVPLLLIALVLGLVILFYIKIKQTLTRAKSPNGPLDGRHNVKVIDRDE